LKQQIHRLPSLKITFVTTGFHSFHKRFGFAFKTDDYWNYFRSWNESVEYSNFKWVVTDSE